MHMTWFAAVLTYYAGVTAASPTAAAPPNWPPAQHQLPVSLLWLARPAAVCLT
jgi:hypothetical protein